MPWKCIILTSNRTKGQYIWRAFRKWQTVENGHPWSWEWISLCAKIASLRKVENKKVHRERILNENLKKEFLREFNDARKWVICILLLEKIHDWFELITHILYLYSLTLFLEKFFKIYRRIFYKNFQNRFEK